IAPDVGEHAQEGFVPPRERTTPAGRFESNPGVNRQGEHIVWVDYDSAFAIHRLRANKAEHARKVRLASSDPLQHRVSYGCVVVPVNFYKDVVAHWLGRGRAVVYVLPDNGSAADFFSAL
ncbi:MAG TPA: L,D-transpeptidase, partial [Ramlibacter sp.]